MTDGVQTVRRRIRDGDAFVGDRWARYDWDDATLGGWRFSAAIAGNHGLNGRSRARFAKWTIFRAIPVNPAVIR
jgi:hypothetical protein